MSLSNYIDAVRKRDVYDIIILELYKLSFDSIKNFLALVAITIFADRSGAYDIIALVIWLTIIYSAYIVSCLIRLIFPLLPNPESLLKRIAVATLLFLPASALIWWAAYTVQVRLLRELIDVQMLK